MKRKLIVGVGILLLMQVLFVVTACSGKESSFNPDVLVQNGYEREDVHVTIDGLKRTYHFLWVSDLHLVVENEQIAEDQMANVRDRRDSMFVSASGERSVDFWAQNMPDVLDDVHADAIFFGADMVDFCSEATIPLLKEGLDKVDTPFIYIRADHDSSPYWMAEEYQDEDHARKLQDSVCENPEIWSKEYDEFVVMGVNRNSYQMTEEGLKEAKEVFALGKPIIMVVHVPYVSEVDPSLQQLSREVRGDRELMWGPESLYVPDGPTQEFFDMIYAEDSPVIEILSGHLHNKWDGFITDRIHEHVFTPAFQKYVGVITVDGGE